MESSGGEKKKRNVSCNDGEIKKWGVKNRSRERGPDGWMRRLKKRKEGNKRRNEKEDGKG